MSAVRAALAVMCVVFLGCSTSSESSAPSSSAAPPASSTTTSTSVPASAVDQNCHTGSSPATYDPEVGTYATLLTDVDTGHSTITFDVIQWLVGDDAVAAYHSDEPDDPEGPPNDYYTVNASEQTYVAPVAASVKLRLVRLQEDGNADLSAGTFTELPAYLAQYGYAGTPYLSGFPFWLTISDGEVVDICEQYRP